jgi:hypothetical protein
MPIKNIYSTFKNDEGSILCLCYTDGTFRLFEKGVSYQTVYAMYNWIVACGKALGLDDTL